MVIVSQKITSLRQFRFFTENMAWKLLSTYTGFIIFTYDTWVLHTDSTVKGRTSPGSTCINVMHYYLTLHIPVTFTECQSLLRYVVKGVFTSRHGQTEHYCLGMLRSIGRRSVLAIITFYDSIGTRTFGRSHVPIAIWWCQRLRTYMMRGDINDLVCGNAMTFWETMKNSLYVVYVLHDDMMNGLFIFNSRFS